MYNAWGLVYFAIFDHAGGGGGGSIFGNRIANATPIEITAVTARTIAVSSSMMHPSSLSIRHFFSAMIFNYT
uniref:Uncharacterized protein n=1 Tax=viral metagenome TaxID=1070528 RepID=A0A6M3JZS5_9ZZZZ